MFIFIVGHICDGKAMLLSLLISFSVFSITNTQHDHQRINFLFGLRKPSIPIVNGLVKFHSIVCPWSSCLLLCLAIREEMSSKYAVYMSIEYL